MTDCKPSDELPPPTDAMSTHPSDSSPLSTPLDKSHTLFMDVNNLLNAEEISDISLIPEGENNDGVPAVKAILAARSPVFRRMLYGEFRETQSNNQDNVEVKLDYSGRVLQLLVEFCFTDKLASLNNIRSGNNKGSASADNNNNISLEEKVRLLTNLSGAAVSTIVFNKYYSLVRSIPSHIYIIL